MHTSSPTSKDPSEHTRRRAHHPWRIFGALVLLLAQIGCAARNSAPEVTGSPYSGPPLHLDRSDRFAQVLFTAPTPGWRVGVDRVHEAFQRRDIFVTIQPPNPDYHFAQVLVEQRVATKVDRTITTRLFARVVAPSPAQSGERPYHLIESSGPLPPPTNTDEAAQPNN